MKLLFFDMEFANGQVGGSIFSFGYLTTDEDMNILTPPVDICINPECEWNAYVKENILAYPMEEVESAPAFPAVYDEIKALFDQCDVAVGFAVSNDVRALKRDCARYGLEAFSYRFFDVERLCRLQELHKEAHGLGGYFNAWCGGEAKNRHRSDGDAYATMLLLQAICRHHHVSADMMIEAYPECVGNALPTPTDPPAPKAPQKRKKRRRRSRRSHSKGQTNASPSKEATV